VLLIRGNATAVLHRDTRNLDRALCRRPQPESDRSRAFYKLRNGDLSGIERNPAGQFDWKISSLIRLAKESSRGHSWDLNRISRYRVRTRNRKQPRNSANVARCWQAPKDSVLPAKIIMNFRNGALSFSLFLSWILSDVTNPSHRLRLKFRTA